MPRALTVLSILNLDARKMGSFEEYLCAFGRHIRLSGGRCVVALSRAPADDVAKQFASDGVEWRVFPFQGKLATRAKAVHKLVRDVRPDVTHFHFVETSSPLFVLARLSGARRIVVSHHFSQTPPNPSPLKRWLGRFRRVLSLAPTSFFITPSRFVQDCLVSYQQIPAEKIHVVYNGVNLRRFDPQRPPSYDVRAKYDIPATAPIVSALAYFIPEKGADDLIRAMRSVRERIPDAHLLLVGDGPELPRLKALADKMGQNSHVRFTGLASGDQLDSLIAETLVTTLTCTWGEAFSLVILEYMAYGKPIVATAVGGTPEAVEDKKTGLLVEPRSPEQIADALVALLEDPRGAAQMGQAARRRAEELFDVDRMASETLAVYRKQFGAIARDEDLITDRAA